MAQTYAEGGGGYQLEYWVGAYYLAAMLGNGHPQGDIGRVARVEFQRGTLGDVVVHGEAPGGASRLDLQVKTSLKVSATQGDFAKVVRQMHDRVTGQPLNRGRDKYGVAVVKGTQTLTQLRDLGERAFRHLDAADFYSTAGALNTDERRILDVVTDILRGLDSVEDAEEAAWRLLGKDLAPLGIPRQTLARLHRRGVFHRVGRGLYVLANADVTEHHTLAEAARRVPHGVVCLLSALRFHDLTTQDPFDVWVAIENKARRPEPESIPLRVVYMSGEAFTHGVEAHEVEGVAVRVYGAAKTVADCFKYRSRVGLDVAIEALRDYRRSDGFDADELWRAAQACRVSTVIRPYLEAVA